MRRLFAIGTALCVLLPAPLALASTPADNGTNASVAWARGITGAGQKIAIIDDGVWNGHPWFAGGRIAEEACFTLHTDNLFGLCGPTDETLPRRLTHVGQGAALPLTADGRMASWEDHGMQVTGAAVGASRRVDGIPRGPRGIAYDAQAVAIKATAQSVRTGARSIQVEAAVRGLQWLAGQPELDLAAVSMSWDVDFLHGGAVDFRTERGSCDSVAETDLWTRRAARAIAQLVSRGTVVVATAPNEADERVGFPACLSDVVAVGAVTRDGEIPAGNPSWPAIDVYATGKEVLLPRMRGIETPANGASIATPTVAGAIALYRQANPRASVSQIVRRLTSTGKRIRVRRGVTRRVLQVDQFLGIDPPSGALRTDCLEPHFSARDGRVRGFFRLVCAPSRAPLHRLAVTLHGPGVVRSAELLDVEPRPLAHYHDRVVSVGPAEDAGGPGRYRLCALLYTRENQIWPARTVCHEYDA